MTTRKKPIYTAPALSKGLEILEYLAGVNGTVTQAELSRALDRSASEHFRMLSVLEERGYVRRLETGGYRLSLKLFSLGQAVGPERLLVEESAGPMREFAYKFGRECHLSLLEDGCLVVLAQEPGPGAVSLRVAVGSRHHPLGTVSGRVILSCLPAEEAAWQMERARSHFHELPLDSGLLGRIRKAGFGWARGESLPGLIDLAVPLHYVGGGTAALATSHFETGARRAPPKEVMNALQRLMEEVGKRLGSGPGNPERPHVREAIH